jgi:TRAP-type C4-dicarboxylate transport system permease small subunit
MTKILLRGIGQLTRVLNGIAALFLVSLMLLTVADVFLRLFGRPILGTYELVSFAGIFVFGLALPFTSWSRQHIFVDFFIGKLSGKAQSVFNVVTRCIVVAVFLWIGWNVIRFGASLHSSGEVSAALRIPFYPVAYVLGACCLIECVVLLCDIVKIAIGVYHE